MCRARAGQGAGQHWGCGQEELGSTGAAEAEEVMIHRMLMWVHPPLLLNVGIHSHRE